MKSREAKLYILHSAWNNMEADGTEIIKVDENVKELERILKYIQETKAKYHNMEKPYGEISEEIAERLYEITDEDGNYAKFYIVEHDVEFSFKNTKKLRHEINIASDCFHIFMGAEVYKLDKAIASFVDNISERHQRAVTALYMNSNTKKEVEARVFENYYVYLNESENIQYSYRTYQPYIQHIPIILQEELEDGEIKMDW